MQFLDAVLLRGLTRQQRIKAALLSGWFLVTVATLWLLKPVRVSSLLAHLGAVETPYVRLAGVATVAVTVMFYSWIINRLSRVAIVRWANLLFGAVLVLFWGALEIWGAALGGQRAFVWAVYILVEIFSVVMIGIFWTYTNDIMTTEESNRLYSIVGLGGILGGIAGGAFVDLFTRAIGPENLLVICAGLAVAAAGLGSLTEAVVHPPPRKQVVAQAPGHAWKAALDGAHEVKASRYLMLIVGIVIAYEFTATLSDFGINVVFERTYHDEVELTKMYGRLGWIVSATALICQLVLVPLLLPRKRVALMVAPVAMLIGGVSMLVMPVIAAAMLLAASDRGLNYSVQQVTKESLYVPLSDTQKYKSKAFIDMFVDRLAKAMAAFVLIVLIALAGASVRVTVTVATISIALWAIAAWRLGRFWTTRYGDHRAPIEPNSEHDDGGSATPSLPPGDRAQVEDAA